MNILVLSQVYWPDTASTAQHLSDLCTSLSKEGHKVVVVTSQHAYEDPNIVFAANEKHQDIDVKRLKNTGFGKNSTVGRLADFLSFNFLIFLYLSKLRKGSFDIVLGMTSPPLVSFLGAFFSQIKKYRFYYWTMDLQPELSIQSGLIRKGSVIERVLTFMGDYVFKKSAHIYVLDRYMKQHAVRRGAKDNQITVVPVWPVVGELYEGERMSNPFRLENGFGDKIVIMYSGNHSFVHPLDTVLALAKELKDDTRFLFVFIGGGVRKKDVTEFKAKEQLENIIQLPYQPRNKIHLSLGASDIQVVILGEGQVGYTHPNKVYGAMFIGKPILYIGPEKSHIGDILKVCPGNIWVDHGQVTLLKQKLLGFAANPSLMIETGKQNQQYADGHYHPSVLIEQMVDSFNIRTLSSEKSRYKIVVNN